MGACRKAHPKMSISDLSYATRYKNLLTSIDDAVIALEVMKELPPDERAQELAQTIQRVIDVVRDLDLPMDSASQLLTAVAAGGQS